MKLPVSLLAALAGLAVAASSADAAAPTCTRGGAKVLAMSGNTSVVSITSRSRVEAHACWIPSGKRFRLFTNLDADEATAWSIVGGRYVGVLRTSMGGVGGGGTAAKSWDARKRTVVHDARACDGIVENPDEEESGTAGGPRSIVFFRGGGIAYTCAGNMISRIADAKGDRALEPNGTTVTSLAVTPSGDRLFYLAGETAKSVGL